MTIRKVNKYTRSVCHVIIVTKQLWIYTKKDPSKRKTSLIVKEITPDDHFFGNAKIYRPLQN